MTILDFITSHPKLAAIICVSNMIAATKVPELTIPVVYMQIFQIAAWSVTIIVGSITIYNSALKFIKKRFKK